MNSLLREFLERLLKTTLYKFELYFRNILTRPRHTVGMNKASLQFHIKENDCFGTRATVLVSHGNYVTVQSIPVYLALVNINQCCIEVPLRGSKTQIHGSPYRNHQSPR